MELAWLVYGINVVSGLNTAISIAVFVMLVVWGILTLAWVINGSSGDDEAADGCFKFWKTIGYIAVPLTILSCFIPGEKTMYTMVGAYAAEQVAKDPKVQQLSGKVLTIIETKLDDIINEKDKKK